jgi:hypothetical protein
MVRNSEPVKPGDNPVELGPSRTATDSGLCMLCGAAVPLPVGDLVGRKLAGGPADPTALRRPRPGGRPAGRARAAGARSGRTPTRSSRSNRARGSAATGSAPGA